MNRLLAILLALAPLEGAIAQHVREDDHLDYSMIKGAIINGEVVPDSETELLSVVAHLESVLITNTAVRKAQETGVRMEVAVQSKRCTGALIAPEVILTAAHCIERDQWAEAIFVTVAGQFHRVKSYVRHPSYKALQKFKNHKSETYRTTGPFDDIALVFLEEKIPEAKTALLPHVDFHLPNGTRVLLAGYGVTRKADRDLPQGLAETPPVLSSVEASMTDGPWRNLRVEGDRTICNGDSGGPALLVYDGRLMAVGIAAASDCQSNAVFMRVAEYSEWIQAEIAQYRAQREI